MTKSDDSFGVTIISVFRFSGIDGDKVDGQKRSPKEVSPQQAEPIEKAEHVREYQVVSSFSEQHSDSDRDSGGLKLLESCAAGAHNKY